MLESDPGHRRGPCRLLLGTANAGEHVLGRRGGIENTDFGAGFPWPAAASAELSLN
jgi:hypothetical protein